MIPAGMRYCMLLLLFNCACTISSDRGREGKSENPPAPGFDLANSDPAAGEPADRKLVAVSGRDNRDNTRSITWRLYGEREVAWHRRSGSVRFESLQASTTYLFRAGGDGGRVQIGEKAIHEPDSLSAMLP